MLLLLFETIDTILIHFSGEETWNFLLGSMEGISPHFAGVVGILVCCLFYNSSKLCRCCSCTLYWRIAESAKICDPPVQSSLSCFLFLAPTNCHGMHLYITTPVLGVFEGFCRKYVMDLVPSRALEILVERRKIT